MKALTMQPKVVPFSSKHGHAGVTLMETIFAIGIILTGLVGLAALIPIAAENAKATIELDRAVSEGIAYAASSKVYGLNNLNSLVIYDVAASGCPVRYSAAPSYSSVYVPSGQPQTVGWKLSLQSQYDSPIYYVAPIFPTPPDPTVRFGKLESPGYAHQLNGSGLTSGICIDAIGMPSPELIGMNVNSSMFSALGSNANHYDYSRFPYYSERYTILEQPNLQLSTAPATAPAWPMSPRMWRATLVFNVQNNNASPVVLREFAPTRLTRNLFGGMGKISLLDGVAKSDPKGILLGATTIGGSIVDTRADNSSDYTWFATLAPSISRSNSFRQSIIVVRQRFAPVPQRVADPLALQTSDYSIDKPTDNPRNERIAWIGQSIGFSGGSGGEVLLYGSAGVSPDVRTGEWIMLSRQPHNVSNVPVGAAVHRWYQVTDVDKPEFNTMSSFAEGNWTSGLGATNVWRRWVTLTGPDWSFGLQSPNNLMSDDTFVTIVDGAVSVFQSEVQLVIPPRGP